MFRWSFTFYYVKLLTFSCKYIDSGNKHTQMGEHAFTVLSTGANRCVETPARDRHLEGLCLHATRAWHSAWHVFHTQYYLPNEKASHSGVAHGENFRTGKISREVISSFSNQEAEEEV